ncbi:MAG: diguanylate cyclase [Planctomycetes bacterium]|nr:diguanylate cyclase [Planctomycetota bacterium]
MQILIADDDPGFLALLETHLADWGYEAVRAEDGKKAMDILRGDKAPRLAILDWQMPGLDGPAICRELRKERTDDYTFLILLTVMNQKENMLEGMNAGADDYIKKPFVHDDFEELQVHLRAAMRILSLQEELIAAKEMYRREATLDSLTRIWNHQAVMDIFRREAHRSGRLGKSLCLAMADLDHFKQVNDTYGHQAGDLVLREVAARIRSVLRPYDSIGRYGGEEFLIVLPECEESAARQVAERIRSAIAHAPYKTGQDAIMVTASLGVAVIDRIDPAKCDDVVKLADEALYRAKDAGRNRVELAAWTGG